MNQSFIARSLRGSLLLLALLPAAAWAAFNWDPIPEADLKATESISSPGAKAEILFEHRTFDSNQGGAQSGLETYSRTKILKAAAASEVGFLPIEIQVVNEKIWEVQARITKPDGTSKEYRKKDFKESESQKTIRGTTKRYTFAAPDIQAGDIIEYHWSEPSITQQNWYHWFAVQRSIPIREYTFTILGAAADFNVQYFNLANGKVTKIDRFASKVEFTHIPAYEEEPYSPPDLDQRGWLMVLFENPYLRFFKNGKVWPYISGWEYTEFKLLTRPNGAIKAKATQLTAGAASSEEKIERLHEFCRNEIINIDFNDSPEFEKLKEKMDQDKAWMPAYTLEKGCGTGLHINDLFSALARAAGFDVQKVCSSSRNFTTFIRHDNGKVLLERSNELPAVKIGETWKVFSPGSLFLPTGMIPSPLEVATSLRCDDENPVFNVNPASPARLSKESRKGRFTLSEDGTLEGDIEVSYSGHFAGGKKHHWHKTSREEIDQEQRKTILERLPAAEITALVWENLTGPKLPLINRYHVRIPGYAELIGDKLVFQPDPFLVGAKAIFSAETRIKPIYLTHAWSEADDIDITLPEGFVFDTPANPVNVSDPNDIVSAKYKLSFKPKQRLFSYKREFAIGGEGTITFQAAAYPVLKKLTEAVLHSDQHSLVIKPKPSPSSAPASSSPSAAPAVH